MVGLLFLLAVMPSKQVPVDRYRLKWPGVEAVVSVSGRFKDARASVETAARGRRRWQRLALPTDWWPLNAKDEDASFDNSDRPSLLPWPGSPRPVIALHVSPLIGVYSTSSLAFFAWSGGRWKLLNPHLWNYAYCDMGAFCFRRNQLHVWDPIYGDGFAHWHAHRFELRIYEYRHGAVRLASKRRTKHSYEPGRHSPPVKDPQRYPPDRVAAVDDPLREFGLKWRWWGKPRR